MNTLLQKLRRSLLIASAGLMSLPVSLPMAGIGLGVFAAASQTAEAYPLVRPSRRVVTRGEVRRVARRTARRTARRINTLPRGYRQVYMYGAPYYYAGGRYYQRSGNIYIEIEFD